MRFVFFLIFLFSLTAHAACDPETLTAAVEAGDEAAIRECTEPTPMGGLEVNCSNAYQQCLQNAADTAVAASDCIMQYRACDTPAYEPGNHDANPGALPSNLADPNFHFNQTWTDYPHPN